MPSIHTSEGKSQRNNPATESFLGFKPLTGNFLYCPNQFFDVCLPNYSRGVVRLVAYMLRRTLGWLDKNGDPIEQDIKVSYNDIVTKAKVSRGAVAHAIDEAVRGGFIRPMRKGTASQKGRAAQAASFMLCWDDNTAYHKDPTTLRGFYAGDGHRTPVPNAFFDCVIPNETLTLIKVVGTVLRHTVGYQNQFGGRRSEAPLSYSYLQQFAGIADRRTLADALHAAIASGYICRVTAGRFHPHAESRRPARYGIRWLGEDQIVTTGSKTQPAVGRYKNPTSSGSISRPADRFKNPTKERTSSKDTFKQQRAAAYQMLQQAGFDDRVAKELSASQSSHDIEQQIAWMEHRGPSKNRLGMLRRAIEDGWSEPIAVGQAKEQNIAKMRSEVREQEQTAKRSALIEKDQRRRDHLRRIKRQFLCQPSEERNHFLQLVLTKATLAFQRDFIERCGIDRNVAPDVLEAFARTHQIT